jgi:hypothetical protein
MNARAVVSMLVLALAVPTLPAVARAQGPDSVNAALLRHPWSAPWVVPPGVPGDSFGVFHFRRVFELREKPARFVVHVSADNRYRLLVNGVQVSAGPPRADVTHWRFATVDLAPQLVAGRNVVAALVWNYGPYRPVGRISYRTGFLVQGDGEAESVVNTGPGWKVLHDEGWRPVPVTGRDVSGYYAATPGEALDARRHPWGWEGADYDDSAWPAAIPFAFRSGTEGGALPRGTHPYGEVGGWQLVPSNLPQMEETLQRIPRLRRAEGVRASDAFLRGAGDLVIPARTRAVLLLDQTYVTNAYPVLETSGGRDATVTMTFAEAAVDSAGRKGNRDEVEGRTIRGVRDLFTLDGGAHRRMTTLSFRTFRYLQLEVQTAEEPLRIHDLHGVFTAYPYRARGRFASDLPWLERMWEMNWRTARLDAWETYFDTPYYEQLQYVGDTRLQCLISLYVAGDDRLVRNAIELFDDSRIPEGITASRYPSYLPQMIPPYSLVWVDMLHDYWMLRDDPAFVQRFLPGARGVLDWYHRHLDGTGLLGPMPWWNYVDAPSFPRGVPPGAEDGHSVVITAQYGYTLRRMAELERALGEPVLGARDDALADSLAAAMRARAWDAGRGLLADTPGGDGFSQHANVLAVLGDLLPQGEQRAVMERVLADTALVPASFYFRFYVDEAMRKVGLADRYLERLEPWKRMLAMGFTTTPEHPEPTRSDSHAWSAHPDYELLATVLGVRPDSPGFRTVRIAPALGPLRRTEGTVAHPAGDIGVSLRRTGARGLQGTVTLPAGVSGVFEWAGRRVPLHEGEQKVEF